MKEIAIVATLKGFVHIQFVSF